MNRHSRGAGAGGEGDLECGGEGGRGGEDVADKDAGVVGGQSRAGEIGAGNGDGDRRARIAGVRRQTRDRRRADAAGVARDGEQIANGIVGIGRDIPLPVDHLRQAAQVVIDVLRLVSCSTQPHSSQLQSKVGGSRYAWLKWV